MKEKLQTQLKEALKARDSLRATTIRSIIAAMQYAEMASAAGTVSEEEGIAILKSELKKRREELEFAQQAGRPELITNLEREAAIISEFLPSQLSPEELQKIVATFIANNSGAKLSDIMKFLKESHAGQYDGKIASQVAQETLKQTP